MHSKGYPGGKIQRWGQKFPPFTEPHNLVGLQEGTYDDDIGSKGKQHSSKLSGIQWDLMRAFLKPKAYEARVCAEEL